MTTTTTDQSIATTWPAPHDWEAKRREYIRRGEAIRGGDYSDAEHKRLGLFKLRDGFGDFHKTRRICTRLAFMVAVDSASIANGCALNVRPDLYPSTYGEDGKVTPNAAAVPILKEGNEAWRRSGVSKRLQVWAKSYATKGDLHLESSVRLMPDGSKAAVIFAHKAQHIQHLRYDDQGIELEHAEIRFTDVIAGYGDGKPVEYHRTLTRTAITTKIGGVVIDALSGANPTGMVTLTHIPFDPDPDDATFSACTTTGYEDSVAIENSADMTVSVLGARNAAPILVLMGGIQLPAAAADGQTPAAMTDATPVMELPVGGDAKIMEASLSAVAGLVAGAERIAAEAKATAPQFLFTDAGASSSGLALSNRATQFVAYIGPRTERFCGGIARALALAICLQHGRAWTDDEDVYEVKGGAALPLDKASLVDLLIKLLDAGGITRSDFVAELQGLGVGVPEEADPSTYEVRAMADKERADSALVSGVERIANASDAARRMQGAPEVPAEEPAAA